MPSACNRSAAFDITRYVFGRTGRRERARQSEDHHALARRLLAHVEPVRSHGAARAPLRQTRRACVGQLVTSLNHAQSFASMRSVSRTSSCRSESATVARTASFSEEGTCPCRESDDTRLVCRSPATLVHSSANAQQQARQRKPARELSPPAYAGMPECRTCRRPFPAAPARAKPRCRATYATQPACPARHSRRCWRATALRRPRVACCIG